MPAPTAINPKPIRIIESIPYSEMVFVKGGTFQMGSKKKESEEENTYLVTVADFWMGQYLVTQALWEKVMGTENNRSRFRENSRPVETVSWKDIALRTLEGEQCFLKRLNYHSGLVSEFKNADFRLPSEAEWEYAAIGGGASMGYELSGANLTEIDEVAWYLKNSHDETKPVGLKASNELGLYDMIGNVWEWSEGRWSNNSVKRPLRGSSWGVSATKGCRISYRANDRPEGRSDSVGFRLCCSLV